MKIGLNLGCGLEPKKQNSAGMAWHNVDANPALDAGCFMDVRDVSTVFGGEIDEIIAKDILEHIPVEEWKTTLDGWVRCLKPGGTIFIQVPSPECIFRQFQAGTIDEATMNRVIYGECTNEWDRHYQLFTLERLVDALKELGLEIIDQRELHVCAIAVGRKP